MFLVKQMTLASCLWIVDHQSPGHIRCQVQSLQAVLTSHFEYAMHRQVFNRLTTVALSNSYYLQRNTYLHHFRIDYITAIKKMIHTS